MWGIQEQAQRNAPIGYSTLGIGLQHIVKDFSGRVVPKRVLVQHGPVEELLRLRIARRLEVHLPELTVIHLSRGWLGQRKNRSCRESDLLLWSRF